MSNPNRPADLSGLDIAIRLKADLLHTLATTDRSRWPEAVLKFLAALGATALTDRTALVVLLAELRQELQLLLLSAHPAQQPAPFPADAPERWAALAPAEICARFRDDVLYVLLPATRLCTTPSALVQRVKNVIEERYADRLTLADIATLVGRSKRHLASRFRQELAMTVHEYLTHVRVRRAAELIREGKKIEAVSLLVGYRSKKNFYRHFKALTGMTPLDYRAATFRIGHPEAQGSSSLTPAPPAERASPTTRVD
jgi:AraC-like DNA-binding protein